MRFTASGAFLAQAKGASKTIRHRVYARLTSDLSEGLGTGTAFTEITDRIDQQIPSFNSKIEYDLGQFTSDKIQLKGYGVQYFRANWLDPTEAKYTELKIESFLTGATDTIYSFAGWVDKKSVKYNELTNTVTFEAFTIDDMMGRFPAEMLTTQYLEESVELAGTGTNGIMCPRIPGMYVTDSNVTDYVLKSGVHNLSHIYEDSTQKVKLDEGSWTEISGGDQTIVNGDGLEKLSIHTRSSELSTDGTERTEQIIVQTAGDTLPYTWYKNISAKYLLKDLYALMGINTVNYDTMEVNTALSDSKISFIDNPPNSSSYTGYKFAIQTDGTDLWLGVGNKLFKKTTSTGEYSLKKTLASGDRIYRIFHNARNGHLWLIHHNWASTHLYASRYIIGTDTLSDPIDMGTRSPSEIYSEIGTYCMDIMDYNYVSTVYKYGILYVYPGSGAADSALRFVDNADLAVHDIVDEETLGYPIEENILFVRGGNYVFFVVTDEANKKLYDYYFDAETTSWTDGFINNVIDDFTIGIFNPGNDKIYWWNSVDSKVQSMPYNSYTVTDVSTLTGSDVKTFYYGNSLVYFTEEAGNGLYSISDTTATLLDDGVYTRHHSIVYHNSRVMGIDITGRLWQYYSTIFFFIKDAAFEGYDLRSALHQILNAFLLIHKVSAKKEAYVYRRCDNAGAPTTTGNALSVTTAETSDITEEVLFGEKYDVVEATNGELTYKYDGAWSSEPIGENTRKFTLDNFLIPSEILIDMCYFAYQFFSVDRHLYRVTLDKVTLWQYEPFDGLTLTFTTTNILISGSGVIYGVTYTPDGGMIVEGLF